MVDQQCLCGSGSYCHVHLRYGVNSHKKKSKRTKVDNIRANETYKQIYKLVTPSDCQGGRRIIKKTNLGGDG
jgi:hypothetical protein